MGAVSGAIAKKQAPQTLTPFIKRLVGVTVIAILALIGSVLTLLMSISMLGVRLMA